VVAALTGWGEGEGEAEGRWSCGILTRVNLNGTDPTSRRDRAMNLQRARPDLSRVSASRLISGKRSASGAAAAGRRANTTRFQPDGNPPPASRAPPPPRLSRNRGFRAATAEQRRTCYGGREAAEAGTGPELRRASPRLVQESDLRRNGPNRRPRAIEISFCETAGPSAAGPRSHRGRGEEDAQNVIYRYTTLGAPSAGPRVAG
jgi:hypothetical protein